MFRTHKSSSDLFSSFFFWRRQSVFLPRFAITTTGRMRSVLRGLSLARRSERQGRKKGVGVNWSWLLIVYPFLSSSFVRELAFDCLPLAFLSYIVRFFVEDTINYVMCSCFLSLYSGACLLFFVPFQEIGIVPSSWMVCCT